MCSAWAYLELLTEQTIVGILAPAEYDVIKLTTWPKDLLSRWGVLIHEAPRRHTNEEIAVLKRIRVAVEAVAKDRNIVVHGLVSAGMSGGEIAEESRTVTGGTFVVQPAWTLFKGASAGKRYPVSAQAIDIILSNVANLTEALLQFNNQHGYRGHFFPQDVAESDWPRTIAPINLAS